MSDQNLRVIIEAVTKGVKEAVNKTGTEIQSAFGKGKAAVTAFNNEVSKSLGGVNGLIKGLMTAGTTLAGISIGKGLYQAAADLQAINRAFEAITGSAEGARDEMDFVRQEANRLGLELLSTASSYKGIAAAGKAAVMSQKDVRVVFTGVAEAAAALGLGADEASGALYAIGQMMSKGNVTAEELRGQLGERLPVAIGIMSKALGVSIKDLDKMMERGELVADEVLPKFGKALSQNFGASAARAISDPRQQINLFSNAILELKNQIANAGFMQALTDAVQRLTTAIKDPANVEGLKTIVTGISEAVAAVISFAAEWPKLTAAIIGIGAAAPILSGLWSVLMGIGAAMTAMGVTAWAQSILSAANSITMATIATGGWATALGSIAGIFAAWTLGQKVGEWIGSFELVQQVTQTTFAALSMWIDRSIMKYLELKKAALDFFGADTTAVDQAIANKQRELEISERVFDSYVNSGEAAEDAGKKVAAMPAVPDKVITGAEILQQVQEQIKKDIFGGADAYDSFMKKAETAYKEAARMAQEYAKQIKDIDDAAAKRQQSLEDKKRDLRRESMTEEEQLADIRLEAIEKSDKAHKLYAEGVRTGNKEMVDAAYNMQGASQDLWLEWGKGTGSVEEAIREVDKLEHEMTTWDTGQKTVLYQLENDMKDVMKNIESLWKRMKLDPVKVEAEADQAKRELAAVKTALDKIKDKTVTVTIKTVNEGGGTAPAPVEDTGGGGGFATGTILSGYGGGDRIRALLEAGEAVIRKESVRGAGTRATAAFNAGRWDVVVVELLKRFGGRVRATAKALKLRTGGIVGVGRRAWNAAGGPVQRFSVGGMALLRNPLGIDRSWLRLFDNILKQLQMVMESGGGEMLEAAEAVKEKAETWLSNLRGGNRTSEIAYEKAAEVFKEFAAWEDKIAATEEKKQRDLEAAMEKEEERERDRASAKGEKTVSVNLNVGGKSAKLQGEKEQVDSLISALKAAQLTASGVAA